MKTIEIPVKAHPTELELLSGIESEKDFSSREGYYSFIFQGRNEAHRNFLRKLIRENKVDFGLMNGQLDQLLGELGAEYSSPRVKQIYVDLCEQAGRISELQEEVNRLGEELKGFEAQIQSNNDPSKVSLLVRAKRQTRDKLEESQANLVAYQNKVASLSRQANETMDGLRAERHLKLRAIGDKAATILNNKIVDAVREYHDAMKRVFPELAESAPHGQTFPAEVYFPHLAVLDEEARELKSFRAIPQIVIRANRYEFGLRSLEVKE